MHIRTLSGLEANRKKKQDEKDELDFSPSVISILGTYARIMCNYVAQPVDQQVMTALRLQMRGADKQRPSLLDMVASFATIVEFKHSSAGAPKREAYDRAIADYNSKAASKAYRIVGAVKDLIRNVMRCPQGFRAALARHYDQYKHEVSAVTLNNLADCGNFFVPGSQRLQTSSNTWQQILTVSEQTSVMWLSRVIGDFERKAPRRASAKIKAQLCSLFLDERTQCAF